MDQRLSETLDEMVRIIKVRPDAYLEAASLGQTKQIVEILTAAGVSEIAANVTGAMLGIAGMAIMRRLYEQGVDEIRMEMPADD